MRERMEGFAILWQPMWRRRQPSQAIFEGEVGKAVQALEIVC